MKQILSDRNYKKIIQIDNENEYIDYVEKNMNGDNIKYDVSFYDEDELKDILDKIYKEVFDINKELKFIDYEGFLYELLDTNSIVIFHVKNSEKYILLY